MEKAYLDSTILTNILLKENQTEGIKAKKELENYDLTLLPVYAIKEFKYSPLQHYVYTHNSFVRTKSYSNTLRNIKLIISHQQRKASTALEALIEASSSIDQNLTDEQRMKYASTASHDSIRCDENRLFLKFLILQAWAKRRKITNEVVNELSCYEEIPPKENRNGTLELKPRGCKKNKKECALANALREKLDILEKLKNSIDPNSPRKEDKERRAALKEIIKHPEREISENICQKLGDAIYAFFAPPDSTIITTNLKDHEPLAKSVGKRAQSP